MGPRSEPPPLPDFEANMLPADDTVVSILHRPCNWMQGWEGEMDTVHQAFLHAGATRIQDTTPGTFDYYIARTPAPQFAVVDTPYGTSYGAYRPAEEDTYYWRIAHMLFPFYAMIPGGMLGSQTRFAAYVPMDDEHTLHWEITRGLMNPDDLPSEARGSEGRRPTPRASSEYKPNTTDWYGRFNLHQAMDNDYFIDREAQRTMRSYTGIPGIRQQDMAVTESHGADLRSRVRAPGHDRCADHPHATAHDQRGARARRAGRRSRRASTSPSCTASVRAACCCRVTSTGGTARPSAAPNSRPHAPR